MSHKGTLYFFACHMLYTAMQIYYEIHENSITETENTNQSYTKWSTPYHAIMGWTLEEIVFPLTHEQVDKREGKAMGDFAEAKDESLYKYVHNTLLNLVGHLQGLCPNIQKETLLYRQYCLFLSKGLDEFSRMAAQHLQSSVYLEHYQDKADTFVELISLLKGEYTDIDQICLPDIESKTDELKNEWSKAVYAAVDHYSR